MGAGHAEQGGERHQIITEACHRDEVGDQIERKHQVGERGQHRETHLSRGVAVEQQLQALDGGQGDGAPGAAQQTLQNALINNAAFQHFGFKRGAVVCGGSRWIGWGIEGNVGAGHGCSTAMNGIIISARSQTHKFGFRTNQDR